MRRALLLLLISSAYAAPSPLAGVPVDLRCTISLPANHPLLQRQPGEDLIRIVRSEENPEPDAAALHAWLRERLCGLIWQRLAESGAHAAPADVDLPARAVLEIDLAEAWLEGSRLVDQRVGGTVMPVAVPHWSLLTHWEVRFHIAYGDGDELQSPALTWNPRSGAEQEDYAPLRLGALLEAATRDSFERLPQLLADEGRLGDLLFAPVEPPRAPAELGLPAAAAKEFWQLLQADAERRHDAMAFVLASPHTAPEAAAQLAAWFLLHDSDLGLRRDALSWLMARQEPADAERPLAPSVEALLRWVLLREPSARLRAEVAHALHGRRTDDVRALLLIASTDEDPRVSDVAISGLRRLAPATAAELGPAPAPALPRLEGWTAALDGRVAPPTEDPVAATLALAVAAGGPAAEQWLTRWLREGPAQPWSSEAWASLADHPSPRVRRHAVARMAREAAKRDLEQPLLDRLAHDPDPDIRALAAAGLRTPSPRARNALLVATRDDAPAVRRAAAAALTGADGSEVQACLTDLRRHDPDRGVRRAAAKALRGS